MGFPRQEYWSGLLFPSSWDLADSETESTSPALAGGFFISETLESESKSHSVLSYSLQPNGLYSLWNSRGQNVGVGILSLLQGISSTQGLNPGLPHCRQILYQLSHKGSLTILEWVSYPFSSRSSWPRNCTRVSCIASRFFFFFYQLSCQGSLNHQGRPIWYIVLYIYQSQFLNSSYPSPFPIDIHGFML